MLLVVSAQPNPRSFTVNRTGRTIPFASLVPLALVVAALGTGCEKKDAQQPPQYAANPGYGSQPPPGAYPQQQPGAYPQQPGAYQQYPQQQPGAYPQQQPAYPQQQPGTYYPQPQTAYPQPAQPGATTQTQQPSGFPFPMPQQSGSTPTSTAQPLDPNLAALATAPLAIFAATEAPGMAKDGPIVAGQFQEGQTLESTFTFQPGRCYTLVAQGVGLITSLQLEMQYVTPIPGISPSIARSPQSGPQASIGGKSNCQRPAAPFPANAKFIVRVARGAGIAAAQLYSK